ncbi:MAG: alpha/beta hydrolase-fold protein [Anaerolineae bacterium]|nr:esterase family protein [Thermoflexales bacterium]MDW8054001.1 alpha/beta hydrolase-fold protein [Anaerolineae bacterium]
MKHVKAIALIRRLRSLSVFALIVVVVAIASAGFALLSASSRRVTAEIRTAARLPVFVPMPNAPVREPIAGDALLPALMLPPARHTSEEARSTSSTRAPTLLRVSAAPKLRAAACPSPRSQVVTEVLESRITAAPIVVHVYLPPCYAPEHQRYPVLYLIHGTAYEQGGWFVHGLPQVAETQMAIGALPPFVIVMPGADMRAGERSRYSWTNGGQGSYEDFFVNELMPFIETRYSVMTNREGRAIGGISRGGYWAIEIAFAHPDLFSAVGGHSPSVFTMLVGVPEDFSMLSWAPSVEALRGLRIWIDAGDRDWARVDAKKLAADLDAAGVPYTLDIGAGSHVDDYWTERLAEYLAFYAAEWFGMPPVEPQAARAQPSP